MSLLLLFQGAPAAAFDTLGWFVALSGAPQQLPPPRPELRPFGVQLVAAQPAPEGWQQQTWQIARPRSPVWPGTALVPFNTRQVNTQTIDKWLVPLSAAKPIPYPAAPGILAWVGQPLVGNNVTLDKWQQPLGKAAPRPPIWQGNAFVPLNTAQIIQNTIAYSLYQQPLSTAVPIPRAALGSTFVPYNTAQIVTVVYGGAFPPLSQAPPIARAAPAGSTFVPYDTAQVVAADRYGWWQPASKAPDPRPQIRPELRPFGVQLVAAAAFPDGWYRPFEYPAVKRPPVPAPRAISIAYPLPDQEHFRWHVPLSTAVAIPRTAPQGAAFVPYNTAQIVTIVYGGAFVPLSRAVDIPRPAQPGASFVPLNTAQVIVTVYGGAFPPLSVAAPIPRAAPTGSTFVPLDTAQVVTIVYGGAFPPLSVATPRPPVWLGGQAWVGQPLAGNNVDLGKWQQPLSRATTRLPLWQGGPSYTFLSTQFTQNTANYATYQQPLSKAAPIPRTAQQGGQSYTFLSTAFTQNTVYWGNYQQPLSRPADRPPVWQGVAFVPFNTVQTFTPTPTQFGWYSPLSTTNTRTSWQARVNLGGYTFVPLNTRQIGGIGQVITDTDALQLPIDAILHGDQHYEMSGREWSVPPSKTTQRTTVKGTKVTRLRGEIPSFTSKTTKKGYD